MQRATPETTHPNVYADWGAEMVTRYVHGLGIATPAGPTPFRPQHRNAASRQLRVYTQDPGASRFDCQVATLAVPWEPTEPGPSGALFVVRDIHQPSKRIFTPIDLESFEVASGQGLKPNSTEPRFAQQMTYAVCMAVYERFQLALGRLPEFAPVIRKHGDGRLEICPHFDADDNAYYDPDLRALRFGYVAANEQAVGSLQHGSYVYTCLSHDVIAHEVSHALLDGMRPLLMLPSNPDVAAFHEGFADLISLFMRFRYPEVVRRGLEDSGGTLDARLLTQFAREWGRTGGDGRAALRQVLLRKGAPDDPVPKVDRYNPRKEHHDLGAVLVAAVFEAMSRVFERKTKDLRKIAALAPGAGDHINALLTKEACKIAGHFLNITIRALDYCPPLDLTFGEFLRAMITADFVTMPDDPYGYREALVLAFRRYGIVVPHVLDLSEESLLWNAPEKELPPVPGMSFAELRHGCEPGWFPEQQERERQADAIGDFVTSANRHPLFGIVPPGLKKEGRYEAPCIESVRTLRRLTPDDDLDFHVVAEISQRCIHNRQAFYGGATVILDETGRVRFVIRKGVRNEERRKATDAFLARAPQAYRDAFGERMSVAPLIRQFHTRKKRKQK